MFRRALLSVTPRYVTDNTVGGGEAEVNSRHSNEHVAAGRFSHHISDFPFRYAVVQFSSSALWWQFNDSGMFNLIVSPHTSVPCAGFIRV
jgi:hypothetical protein